MGLHSHQRQRVSSWSPTDGVLFCYFGSRRKNPAGAEENFQQHEIQDPREAALGPGPGSPAHTASPCSSAGSGVADPSSLRLRPREAWRDGADPTSSCLSICAFWFINHSWRSLPSGHSVHLGCLAWLASHRLGRGWKALPRDQGLDCEPCWAEKVQPLQRG